MHISRKLCLLLLLVPFARGQTVSKTFTITSTATTNCPTLDVGSNETVGIDVSGTFSATLQPQVIIGGGNAARNTAVEHYGSTTRQSTITAAGGYHTVDLAGATTFVMCASAYVSGTATVVLTITPVSSRDNSASGTVTSIATTSPITGGTITTTGTIACGTCGVTGSPLSQFASTTSAQLAGVLSDETGTGVAVFATSPALTTPNIGAATGTSLLVSGNIDGTAPITITTGTTANLGATFKSGYTFNQEATAAAAVTYTLPATAVGLQYCVRNSIVSGTGAANTGVLTVYPPASSFVILNGVRNTVGGGGTHGVASSGAAGDSACFVAIDATDWEVYVIRGTWTAN